MQSSNCKTLEFSLVFFKAGLPWRVNATILNLQTVLFRRGDQTWRANRIGEYWSCTCAEYVNRTLGASYCEHTLFLNSNVFDKTLRWFQSRNNTPPLLQLERVTLCADLNPRTSQSHYAHA
jgi:hypothetical protein